LVEHARTSAQKPILDVPSAPKPETMVHPKCAATHQMLPARLHAETQHAMQSARQSVGRVPRPTLQTTVTIKVAAIARVCFPNLVQIPTSRVAPAAAARPAKPALYPQVGEGALDAQQGCSSPSSTRWQLSDMHMTHMMRMMHMMLGQFQLALLPSVLSFCFWQVSSCCFISY
jgi:hypothetical protein